MSLKFDNLQDSNSVSEVLRDEPICDVFTSEQEVKPAQGPTSAPFFGCIIYCICLKGTIIGLWYDFIKQSVIKVHITQYIKTLIGFDIRKIVAHQNTESIMLAILVEGDVICIVQIEHNCEADKSLTMLQVDKNKDDPDILDMSFSIGLEQCSAKSATEIIVNKHNLDDPQIIVANEAMIEIF